MKSADYWRQRAEAVEAQAHARAQASIAQIEQWYLEAQREVQKEIESWYARFATSEGLFLADARKLLNSRELEEFRWTVEQYVKAGASGDPRWAKQLENASARFHVSRLEAVQLQMQQQLERLYGNQLDEMESLFRQVAGDTYTRTAFDLMQGIGVAWDITAPDEKVLDKILSTPWSTDNATFRDRCWTMKDELRAQLQKDLTQGLMTGKPPLEISKGIEKRFGVSRYKAARLVNTETTYFNAVSSQQCYKDLDVERFEVIVTLDDTTCEICGKMDGKILPMPQYEPGVTVPPYHPNCRCTTAPAIDPEFAGERAARAEGGEVYYVPADMTYPEWREKFVEGGDKDGLKKVEPEKDKGKIKNTTSSDEPVIKYEAQEETTTKNEDSGDNSGLKPADESATIQEDKPKVKTPNIQFSPAATLEEAEAFLSSLGVEGHYVKGKINLDVANVINRTVAEYIDVFGDKIKLRSIRKWPKAKADFVASYSSAFGDVFLYRCSDKKALSRILEDTVAEYKAGAWSTGAVEHFIRHELGHAVHFGVRKTTNRDALIQIFEEATSGLEYGKHGFLLKDYKAAGLSDEKFIEDVRAAGDILSAYGFTKYEEMIAESVAEYMSGSPRDFALKVVNTLMGW